MQIANVRCCRQTLRQALADTRDAAVRCACEGALYQMAQFADAAAAMKATLARRATVRRVAEALPDDGHVALSYAWCAR